MLVAARASACPAFEGAVGRYRGVVGDDAELHALKEAAYGRHATDADRRALQDALSARRAAEAPPVEPPPAALAPEPVPTEEAAAPRAGWRPRSVLIATAVAFALGAGAASAPGLVASLAPASPLDVFERPQAPPETYLAELFREANGDSSFPDNPLNDLQVDDRSLRLVGSTDGLDFVVFQGRRESTGDTPGLEQVCLGFVSGFSLSFQLRCVAPYAVDRTGILMEISEITTVRWGPDGTEITSVR
jgi:hypothetical protein